MNIPNCIELSQINTATISESIVAILIIISIFKVVFKVSIKRIVQIIFGFILAIMMAFFAFKFYTFSYMPGSCIHLLKN